MWWHACRDVCIAWTFIAKLKNRGQLRRNMAAASGTSTEDSNDFNGQTHRFRRGFRDTSRRASVASCPLGCAFSFPPAHGWSHTLEQYSWGAHVYMRAIGKALVVAMALSGIVALSVTKAAHQAGKLQRAGGGSCD